MIKIYRDKDASLKYLKKKEILILGYGSQGRAFALNLKDAGYQPIICLPPKSKTRNIVKSDKLNLITPTQINDDFNLILFMIPDHIQGDFYSKYISDKIAPNSTLLFAHAYSIHFKLIKPAPELDIILVAPHGPGQDLRDKYLDNSGLSCFVGAFQDSSGIALKTALAVAKAVRATKAGAFLTSFEHEAIGDLFGEQVLLCGGLSELIIAAFETLVKHGLPPENAYLETVHQIDLLAKLIKEHGLQGMSERISKTAQYGMLKTRGKIIDRNTEKRIDKIYAEIKSGKFAQDWQNEYNHRLKSLDKYKQELKKTSLEKTAAKMRKHNRK